MIRIIPLRSVYAAALVLALGASVLAQVSEPAPKKGRSKAKPAREVPVGIPDKGGPRQEADREFTFGFTLNQECKFDEAIEHTRLAVKLNPLHASAHYNLGYFLARKGQLDDAILHTRTSLKIDPNNANAHYNLGYFLQSKGQLDEAEKHYREAVRLNPGAINAHQNLGVVLTGKNRLAEAAEHNRKAAEINAASAVPSSPPQPDRCAAGTKSE